MTASPPVMSPDEMLAALLRLPRLGSYGVSRDGRMAAWTWTGAAPTAQVFAGPAEGEAAPVQLTHGEENSWFLSWAPDGQSIVVAQDHGGDERVQLLRVTLDGEMTPLTDASPPYYLRGGQLHPNGRWLVYAMNYDVAAGQEIEPAWIYRHDLDTGERVPLARPEKAAFNQVQLNDQGSHILYIRQDLDPAGGQLWLADIEGREDREILNFGPSVKIEAVWFPDGQHILFLAEAGSYRKLGMWTLATGEIRRLIDDPDRNIEWAFVPRGLERPAAVVVEVREARMHASLLDIAEGTEIPVPDVPGDLVPLRPLPSGSWIGTFGASNAPTDLVRFSLAEPWPEDMATVTGLWDRTTLSPADLIAAEDMRWQGDDLLPLQGWLYRPRGPVLGTIVLVHGGPTSRSGDEFLPNVQYFAARGFNVLLPNYRGSTGFGLEFQEAIKVDGWGGREQDDIRAGIEALIAAGIARPGHVGITGTSYGGYSSWCAITRWPVDTVAAAAPICGMTDLVVDYETTRPDLRPYSEEMMGGRPDQAPERYRERSPIHVVDRIQGRLLIVQGERDPNVTPANVAVVRAALDAAGVPYEVLTFADEGHGIARRVNREVLYRRLADFFASAFAPS